MTLLSTDRSVRSPCFAELNDTALYGSQRPLTLFAELNDTALYGSQRPLTLFAELNDTALYGSQRQVLGHAVNCFHTRMTYSE
ncbi:hypothetical protein, partial [Leptospira santarosai]|uniref:hypothetical protein n=1 Tax=Leptospira santarosai TaxID=28183 RepID=UPI0024AF74A9